MSSSFATVSPSNISTSINVNNRSNDGNFSNVKINVADIWSKKKGISTVPNPIPSNFEKSEKETNFELPRRLKSFNIYITEDDNIESVNEYETIPDQIEGSYKYDFNIMSVHDTILKKFKHQREYMVSNLQKELEMEKDRLKTRQNMVERKRTLKNIKQLEDEIENIMSDKDFQDYIDKITPYIKEYNLLGALSTIVSFAKAKKEEDEEIIPEDSDTQEKRQKIISDFIEIARKYITIDLIRDINIKDLCPGCGKKLEDNIECKDDDSIVCSCGYEKITIARSQFYKDTSRVNNARNNYEDRNNFLKLIMCFQGKEPDKPGPELYDALDAYFTKEELPRIANKYHSSEQIRELPMNEYGEKPGTSRLLMYKALKETGNANQYDHINIILHTYWGWKLHDITHLEDILMDDYDKFQKIYEMLPKDRKSSLNRHFRLYKHLLRRGYPCRSCEFKIPTTPDILEFHNTYWDKMCEIADNKSDSNSMEYGSQEERFAKVATSTIFNMATNIATNIFDMIHSDN